MARWGSLYLVRPDWDGDDETVDEAVVEECDYAKHFLRVAPELWYLAGHEDRAEAIRSLVFRAYERQQRWLTASEIEELLRLLEGVEDALVGSVVDERWRIPPEQLPELRVRTEYLDLNESRGELAVSGVAEGISHVCSLRTILREALARGLLVSLD